MDNRYYFISTPEDIAKIDVQTFNQLGCLALSLKPVTPCTNITSGYIDALKHYFRENINDSLYTTYSIIMSDNSGELFLKQTIELLLLETAMRTFGIDAKSTVAHQKLSEIYNQLITCNNINYNEILAKKNRYDMK